MKELRGSDTLDYGLWTVDTLLGALGKLLLLHTVRVGVRIALNFNQAPAAKPLRLIVWLFGLSLCVCCVCVVFFLGNHANLVAGISSTSNLETRVWKRELICKCCASC